MVADRESLNALDATVRDIGAIACGGAPRRAHCLWPPDGRTQGTATGGRDMPQTTHPARLIPYDELVAGLDAARANGFVRRHTDVGSGLQIFCYNRRCMYKDGWDPFTIVARGLVIDPVTRSVVATPFPKFFNKGEKRGEVPDLPFEAFDKLDGSLVIAFHHGGRWRTATKAAFASDTAVWAQARLDGADTSGLVPGTTYLFEAMHAGNRVVVRYEEEALAMLAAYDADGRELGHAEVSAAAEGLGLKSVGRRVFASMAEATAEATALSRDFEGYVVRFEDGTRLKLKGAEYRRVHAIVSGCTPLPLFEAWSAGDDLESIRRDLPEEFLSDFDAIIQTLEGRKSELMASVMRAVEAVAGLSDKDLGRSRDAVPADLKGFVFDVRKNGKLTASSHRVFFDRIRPHGDVLPGYEPSYALQQARNEDETLGTSPRM